MNHFRRIFLLLCCLTLLAGCSSSNDAIPSSARRVLEHADSFELLSLWPRSDDTEDKAWRKDTREILHWTIILGGVPIKSAADRQNLLDTLDRATDDKIAPHACFNPRHAIRAVRDSDTVEVVICFECEHMEVWYNGERIGGGSVHDVSSVFNKPLTDAGIELSHRPVPTSK